MSGITFRSLIHFEFIFVSGVKYSNFILLHVAVQFSQHHLVDIGDDDGDHQGLEKRKDRSGTEKGEGLGEG